MDHWYKQILECLDCKNNINYCDKCREIYNKNIEKFKK